MAVGCGFAILATLAWVQEGTVPASSDAAEQRGSFGRIPAGFEVNEGQAKREVKFLARGSAYGLFLTRDEIVLALGRMHEEEDPAQAAATVRMGLVGPAGRRRLVARGRIDRNINYLVGDDAKKWQTGISTFRTVSYEDVYPGIDLVLYGNQRRLQYDFELAPGADPSRIGLLLGGGETKIAESGDLVIMTPAGEITQRRPFAYQRIGGARREIASRFVLERGRLGFELGDYNEKRPLVIDPVIEYSTFLGGAASYDQVESLALGEDGSAYMGGLTFAADFPASSGAFDRDGPGPTACAPAQDPGFEPPPQSSACQSDGFIVKLNPSGTRIVYSTFLGGGARDRIQDIAVDAKGAVYATGGTDSSDFPTSAKPADTTAAGERRVMGVGLVVLGEAFVAKLSRDGSSLKYSTLLGGQDAEEGMGIALGRDGSAYVAGHTFSEDFPTSKRAYDRNLNRDRRPTSECSDIFATRVNPRGRSLRYSTLVGGSRLEFAWDLDVDSRGTAVVMGESTSRDAPVTPDAIQRFHHVRPDSGTEDCARPLTHLDDADPLIVELSPGGRSLRYATYFGGSRHEHGTSIAVRGGDVYIAGHTNSPDFPTTPGAFDRMARGTESEFDGFAAKFTGGRVLEYSTLIGGGSDDWIHDVAVDRHGAAYLAGMTTSDDFPTTTDALDRDYVGVGPPFYDAFLGRINASGSKLLYSSYLGGQGPDVSRALAVDATGSAYLAGLTFSPDLSVTESSADPVFGGPPAYSDGFVSKLSGFEPLATSAARRQPMRLSVKPRQTFTGRRTTFTLRVTTVIRGSVVPVPGAKVALAGRHQRVNRAGRAKIRFRPGKAGRDIASARARGFRKAQRAVVVRARRDR